MYHVLKRKEKNTWQVVGDRKTLAGAQECVLREFNLFAVGHWSELVIVQIVPQRLRLVLTGREEDGSVVVREINRELD